jgi:hypothetical protein
MAGPIKPTEPGRPAYAVCPLLLHGRGDLIRDPKLFKTEAEALQFLRSEILPGSIDTQPIRNQDRGWQDPVPVLRIGDVARGAKCRRTFREFLPFDRAAHSMPAMSASGEIARALEDRSGDCTCYLDADSCFDEIEADARKRVGHEYEGRRHGSIVEIVLGALYDLEKAFQKFHPDASCAAVSAFWQSWQVASHVANFCSRLGDSDVALQLTGSHFVAGQEAERARVHVYRQLLAFAHELLDEATPSSAAGTIPARAGAAPPGRDESDCTDAGPIGPIPQFPKRAAWLKDQLWWRGWNKHDLARHGRLDHKTVQKILYALPVREDVLEKMAKGLSMGTIRNHGTPAEDGVGKQKSEVTMADIPRD